MTKRGALFLVLALGVAAAGGAVLGFGPLAERGDSGTMPAAHLPTYQCSMHPEIVANEPGNCPICQMKLHRVEADAEPAQREAAATAAPSATTAQDKPQFYRHPMRPEITSKVPAKDEMGMDYIPVYADEVESGSITVPGHAAFTLSRERQQLIGVTRGRVEVKPLVVEVRAVGRVAYDPALYQAVIEYREALRSRDQIRKSSLAEAHHGADGIVRAARLKLRQQGLADAQIEQLTGGAADPTELLLPGDAVWVYAQVYEYQSGLIAPGQTMEITAPSLPGRKFSATVAAIDPILDPMTRSVRVRALVPTPAADLRPESYVDVKIQVPLGMRLALPRDAVLDTGDHQIVFVVSGEGRFEPRMVELGADAQGSWEVLSGLAAGEEVLTSANFLIDSESRFRAARVASASSPAQPGAAAPEQP